MNSADAFPQLDLGTTCRTASTAQARDWKCYPDIANWWLHSFYNLIWLFLGVLGYTKDDLMFYDARIGIYARG